MKKKLFPVFGLMLLACISVSFDCKSQTVKYLILSNANAQVLLDNVEKDKISFQFYHDQSNNLTLYAWPKNNNTDENDDSEVQILEVNPAVSAVVLYDLNNRNVLLATLNIGKAGIKQLSDALKLPANAFLIFYPKIDPIANSSIAHLYYDIYGSPTKDFDINKLAKQPIATIANPSPPYKPN